VYHDEKNWAYLRASLIKMNRAELIGDGPNQLVPAEKSMNRRGSQSAGRRGATGAPNKKTGRKPSNKAVGGQWSSRSRK